MILVLSTLMTLLFGLVDLGISAFLGAQGQQPNLLFGWAMIITACFIMVAIVSVIPTMSEQDGVGGLEAIMLLYMSVSFTITLWSGLMVLKNPTPHLITGWIPLGNLALFVMMFITFGFWDQLETWGRKHEQQRGL